MPISSSLRSLAAALVVVGGATLAGCGGGGGGGDGDGDAARLEALNARIEALEDQVAELQDAADETTPDDGEEEGG